MSLDQLKIGLEAAKALGEIVKNLWSLRGKLVAQPEPAAYELAQALEQVHKTFRAVAAEIARYKSLGVTRKALHEGTSALAELEGYTMRARVDAARGHSSMIGNIYRKHLDKWFKGVLSKDEYDQVKKDFSTLGNADRALFDQMFAICRAISIQATLVLDLVQEEKWEEARARIVSHRKSLRKLEKYIASP